MKVNYRRCISCRQVAPKEKFWRIVRNPDGQIKLDYGMGRSAYLCPQIDCLVKAKQKNRLQKSLRIGVPEQIYHTLEKRLTKNSTSRVSGDDSHRQPTVSKNSH